MSNIFFSFLNTVHICELFFWWCLCSLEENYPYQVKKQLFPNMQIRTVKVSHYNYCQFMIKVRLENFGHMIDFNFLTYLQREWHFVYLKNNAWNSPHFFCTLFLSWRAFSSLAKTVTWIILRNLCFESSNSSFVNSLNFLQTLEILMLQRKLNILISQ